MPGFEIAILRPARITRGGFVADVSTLLVAATVRDGAVREWTTR
jgi:hypothetical protein